MARLASGTLSFGLAVLDERAVEVNGFGVQVSVAFGTIALFAAVTGTARVVFYTASDVFAVELGAVGWDSAFWEDVRPLFAGF